MAPISYPFTLTAGTPENVNQLNANLNAILAQFNGNIELAQLAPSVQALLVPAVPAEFQAPVLDVGMAAQLRAGRQLAGADFTTLCGLPTLPVGLFNLGDLTNLGSGGALLNKGVVTFASGINGVASTAAQFTGSTGQGLYIADTGASDPFRLRTGSWGCWFRTAKRGTDQYLVTKAGALGTNADVAWTLRVSTSNTVFAVGSDSVNAWSAQGITDVADDRWHHAVTTYDGAVQRLYIDGVFEAASAFSALLSQLAKPFNIGGMGADAGTAAINPFFGRIDEAFVTPDILSDDQIRLLYCAKIAHGFASAPTSANLLVRRRKRGGDLITTDFPSQPIRLHNFAGGALTDAGTGNVVLTNNGTALAVAGADGQKDGAFNFVAASSQSLSSTDAGLPSGTSTRSFGAWFKTSSNGVIVAWGGALNTADTRIGVGSGSIGSNNGADSIAGPFVADGQWHFAVVVEDNAAIDGVKRKLYVDGRCVGGSTTIVSVTLTGANRLRIGSAQDATNFFTGQIDGVFVHSVAFTPEQIAALYAKGSQSLPVSIKEPGEHIEAFDATNIYATFDTLDLTAQIDLKVAL